MTDTDLDALLALAEAATPGPWRQHSGNEVHAIVLGEDVELCSFGDDADAALIAACSPERILQLIKPMKALAEAVEADDEFGSIRDKQAILGAARSLIAAVNGATND